MVLFPHFKMQSTLFWVYKIMRDEMSVTKGIYLDAA